MREENKPIVPPVKPPNDNKYSPDDLMPDKLKDVCEGNSTLSIKPYGMSSVPKLKKKGEWKIKHDDVQIMPVELGIIDEYAHTLDAEIMGSLLIPKRFDTIMETQNMRLRMTPVYGFLNRADRNKKNKIRRNKMEQFTIIPENEKEHKEMQEKLFEGGFSWHTGGKKIRHISNCSITTLLSKELNNDSDTGTPFKSIERANKYKNKIITSKEFLENPEIVDGWELPELAPEPD